MKKFFAPTVVKTDEIGLLLLALQSLSILTVKISAENMKSVGLVLGVVIVKLSMLLRVALTRIVEHEILVPFGKSKLLIP